MEESRMEPLEKLFQKLEEESEQRARILADEDAASLVHSSTSSSAVKFKERRRGSISISRIGQLVKDDAAARVQDPPLTPISSLYHHQLANESNTSVASGASEFSDDHAAHDEDENAVTQMEHIAGKPSISSMLIPRRLMRSHSTSVIPSGSITQSFGGHSGTSMQIGVSVQEAVTVLETTPEEADTPVARSRRASVVAQAQANTIRHKSSNSSLGGLRSKVAQPSNLNWLTKAKNVTLRPFRRHSSMSNPSKLR